MNIQEIGLASETTCSGCGACMNVCKHDAIKLEPNENGFIMPIIDSTKCVKCMLCSKLCTANIERNKEQNIPQLYAIRANDELRRISSSGGAFTVFATEIINQGGVVCGAAFDSDMELKHIIVDRIEDLGLLRGSKYVQSHTNNIYNEIYEILKSNKKVLFTGTPCQVAAMKVVAGKNKENLITAAIVCHGVPSQKMLKLHLNEISNGKKITNIEFRNKKFGWTSLKIRVTYQDGSSYEGSVQNDYYEKAFHNNLILRESCSECKYCTLPHDADISMGDFWGYELIDRQYADAKGTSMILINSDKGNSLLQLVSKEFNFIHEYEYEPQKLKNRIGAKYTHHANKNKFFSYIKKHSFSESVKHSLSNKVDIGLVGIYTCPNYGGALTYYALYNYLKDSGYDTLLIERPKSAKSASESLENIYDTNPYESYALAPIYDDKLSMRKLNERCETFLVGSDQLFNDFLYNEFDRWITLDWVTNNKKKIAYAASFGHDHIWSPEQTRAEMELLISKFDKFSVREKSGVPLMSNEFSATAEWVLDPVFLCDVKHYKNLAREYSFKANEEYISSYILDPTKEKENIINHYCKSLNLNIEIYSEMHYTEEFLSKKWSLPVKNGKINERIASMLHSKFIITDSFHGMCFAIIFNKPFVVINNKLRGSARFEAILSLTNLNKRLIESITDVVSIPNVLDIDYKKVNKVLNKKVDSCKKWLQEALILNVKRGYSEYDLLMERFLEQNSKLQKLQADYNNLQDVNRYIIRQIRDIQVSLGHGLKVIDILDMYIDELVKNIDKYVITIAVKDTPGLALDHNLANRLMKLGINTNLSNAHWHSYVGVIDEGKILCDKISKEYEPVEYVDVIDNTNIEVISKSYTKGNVAQILINNIDYAVNKRGLNIAVYNKCNKQVEDTICFDTHEPKIQVYR